MFMLCPQLASAKYIDTWIKFIIIMVLVKSWPFSHVLISGNIGPQIVFYDSLERKNAFLGYKNKNIKKSKNWHFSKGVSQWFLTRIGHFCIFLF